MSQSNDLLALGFPISFLERDEATLTFPQPFQMLSAKFPFLHTPMEDRIDNEEFGTSSNENAKRHSKIFDWQRKKRLFKRKHKSQRNRSSGTQNALRFLSLEVRLLEISFEAIEALGSGNSANSHPSVNCPGFYQANWPVHGSGVGD